jgi:hypothetical protein
MSAGWPEAPTSRGREVVVEGAGEEVVVDTGVLAEGASTG